MNSKVISVIGLMSGTSLDGLDVVLVHFNKENKKDFDIIFSKTLPYNKTWRLKLANSINQTKEELDKLDLAYGDYLGEAVNSFIKTYKITDKIAFVASHGHTVLHQPEKGITLQIGNGKRIAEITNLKVICDFRTQDVLLGGHGAPLVPIGDELLFSDFDACLNLGGFANISYKEENKRIAFDICPVNIVLNKYVSQLNLAYDDKGILASKGSVNKTLLAQLNHLEFYQKVAPKSLGLEWVQECVFPLINSFDIEIKDVLRTFIEHIAIQISLVTNQNKSLLITGGGAFNTFLIDRIDYFTKSQVVIPNDKIVNYKEALIFALLGVLKIDNQVNCLKSVTGASKDHSSGVIFIPKK